MTRHLPQLCILLALACSLGQSAEPKKKLEPSKIIEYKTVKRKGKTYNLKLHVFNPKNHKATDKKPCMVLFHSGG